jgi:hypothetical protein
MLHPAPLNPHRQTTDYRKNSTRGWTAQSQLKTPRTPGEKPLVTQLVADAGFLAPASFFLRRFRRTASILTNLPFTKNRNSRSRDALQFAMPNGHRNPIRSLVNDMVRIFASLSA